MFNITPEHDAILRQFARRLDSDEGENAYHDVVVHVMESDTAHWKNPMAVLTSAIRRRVAKIHRDAARHSTAVTCQHTGALPCGEANLRLRWERGRNMYCASGHEMSPENTMTQGRKVVTHKCRTCYTLCQQRRAERVKADPSLKYIRHTLRKVA